MRLLSLRSGTKIRIYPAGDILDQGNSEGWYLSQAVSRPQICSCTFQPLLFLPRKVLKLCIRVIGVMLAGRSVECIRSPIDKPKSHLWRKCELPLQLSIKTSRNSTLDQIKPECSVGRASRACGLSSGFVQGITAISLLGPRG
jgi:hypothetical protein